MLGCSRRKLHFDKHFKQLSVMTVMNKSPSLGCTSAASVPDLIQLECEPVISCRQVSGSLCKNQGGQVDA